MRAEGQAHIERIEKALALVRKFLDWDRALRRLDELNARVEDPKLWDNPKDAEAVMKERRQLESAIGTVRDIGSQMADAIEYIDLGESEDDEATVEEGLATLAALADRADRFLQPPPLAHDFLRRLGIVPQRRILDLVVKLCQPPVRLVPVEEPAEQLGGGVDLVDMGLRFGAHDIGFPTERLRGPRA